MTRCCKYPTLPVAHYPQVPVALLGAELVKDTGLRFSFVHLYTHTHSHGIAAHPPVRQPRRLISLRTTTKKENGAKWNPFHKSFFYYECSLSFVCSFFCCWIWAQRTSELGARERPEVVVQRDGADETLLLLLGPQRGVAVVAVHVLLLLLLLLQQLLRLMVVVVVVVLLLLLLVVVVVVVNYLVRMVVHPDQSMERVSFRWLQTRH